MRPDIIAGGRLQLGISRGSPEQVIDGWRYFGYAPPEGMTDARHGSTTPYRGIASKYCVARDLLRPNPRPMFPNPPGFLPGSSRTRRACVIESGGARVRTRPLPGQPSSE